MQSIAAHLMPVVTRGATDEQAIHRHSQIPKDVIG